VLADEPTSALDSQTGREVVDLLLRLAREQGCPILMVTHDTRIADVADRIVPMEDGRIVTPPDRAAAGSPAPSEGVPASWV
jgi:putative ABC transport system ATP-binding protein